MESEKLGAPSNLPFWKCRSCGYILQKAVPPDTCPSCKEACEFADVTCYTPECGHEGPDNRLR